jgi:hypothetical protein
MKKINLYGVFLFTAMIFLLSSCISDIIGVTGKGKVVSEARKVTAFDAIEMLGNTDVDIVKADTFGVVVSDYENLLEYMDISVSDKVLTIKKVSSTKLIYNSVAKITVSLPDPLYTVTLGGSGDINVNSPFNDIQTVKILGVGNISMMKNAQYSDLKLALIGSGNIEVNGATENVTSSILGSGNLNLPSLAANKADCNISGVGNIYINAIKELKVVISGKGKIEYSGNPVVNTTITGTGSVVHK